MPLYFLETRSSNAEVQELRELSDEVLDTSSLFYKFSKDGNISIRKQDGSVFTLTDLDYVFARATNNHVSWFAKVADKIGCTLDRPVSAFTTNGLAKANSELNKHFNHTNKIDWYLIFNSTGLFNNIQLISFPIVYKPMTGSHGNGIELIENREQLINKPHDWSLPMFLQEFLDKRFEYRVISYNGKVINFARKVGLRNRNFTGRRFESRNSLHSDYVNYIEENSREGLVGIDIVRTRNRNPNIIYIVEENRAPEFSAVDRATGLSTAELIVQEMRGNGGSE